MESLVRRRTLCVAIAALFAMGGVHAQNTSSSMSGRVLDAAGAPVVGGSVKIVHVPSGTTREVTTDADGRYRAQGLRLGGPFNIIATTPSGTTERDGVYLQLAQDTNLDLSLATPASTATNLENVQVHANASDVAMAQTFNADNKGMGVRVSRQQLDVLPVPNRSIQDIARLNPTINITNKSKGEISALGQNSRYNNITIDGAVNNDVYSPRKRG